MGVAERAQQQLVSGGHGSVERTDEADEGARRRVLTGSAGEQPVEALEALTVLAQHGAVPRRRRSAVVLDELGVAPAGAASLRVQQAPEHRLAVRGGQAPPVDLAVGAQQRQPRTVPDQPVLAQRRR